MPEQWYRKRRFNQKQADKFWATYTKGLSDSLSETEKEGLEKGYSSYQIERLWQEKTVEKSQKRQSEEQKKRVADVEGST